MNLFTKSSFFSPSETAGECVSVSESEESVNVSEEKREARKEQGVSSFISFNRSRSRYTVCAGQWQ